MTTDIVSPDVSLLISKRRYFIDVLLWLVGWGLPPLTSHPILCQVEVLSQNLKSNQILADSVATAGKFSEGRKIL